MGKIYLVRHGQTAWNKARIFRGRVDVKLNEEGRLEAACAAEALKGAGLRCVICSPLSRARDTAMAIAEKHDLVPIPDPAFIDIDYGDWTEFWDIEARRRFKAMYELWESRPHLVRFPNGESLGDVRNRAYPRMLQLAEQYQQHAIAIVTHRVVIKVLLCAVQGLDDSHFWEVRLDTGAISLLEYEKGKFRGVRLNDASHLERLAGRARTIDF